MLQSRVHTHGGRYLCEETLQGFTNESLFYILGGEQSCKMTASSDFRREGAEGLGSWRCVASLGRTESGSGRETSSE